MGIYPPTRVNQCISEYANLESVLTAYGSIELVGSGDGVVAPVSDTSGLTYKLSAIPTSSCFHRLRDSLCINFTVTLQLIIKDQQSAAHNWVSRCNSITKTGNGT